MITLNRGFRYHSEVAQHFLWRSAGEDYKYHSHSHPWTCWVCRHVIASPRKKKYLTTGIVSQKQKENLLPYRDPITFWEWSWNLHTLQRRWLYTPIILWRSVIGSLGLTKMEQETERRDIPGPQCFLPRSLALSVPLEVIRRTGWWQPNLKSFPTSGWNREKPRHLWGLSRGFIRVYWPICFKSTCGNAN